MSDHSSIDSISAVTLIVSDMARSLHFYASLSFELAYGAPDSRFASLRVGNQFLNLMLGDVNADRDGWGRVIFYVSDVDATYRIALDAGHNPQAVPRNAEWGERYFHLDDPDGHGLSFARRL